MIVDAPRSINLAQRPTPLQPLNRLSKRLGGPRIWLKRDDLTGMVLSGNKVRKLEFTLAHAIDQGCDTIITCGGLQSNHCRATAMACAELGLHCHWLLRGSEPEQDDGNFLLDRLLGATVECIATKTYQAELDDLLSQRQKEYASKGHRAWIIPTGASDGIGIWGYIAAFREILNDAQQHQLDLKHVLTATGSGGTQAGLTLGAAMHANEVAVWGVNVCDDERWFLDKVAHDLNDWRELYAPNWPLQRCQTRVIDGYVGPGYAKADPEIFQSIAELARLEGVVLDPVYTGKAFYALTQELKAGRFGSSGDIVFVHTGGTFGLFPQKRELQAAMPAGEPLAW